MSNIQVSLRIPPHIHERLVTYTQAARTSKSEAILAALVQYLDNLPPSPVPLKLAELEQRIAQLEAAQQPAPDQGAIAAPETLSTFTFETLEVNAQGQILTRLTRGADYFTQALTPEVNLEMVAIPSGSFFMGSSDQDQSSYPQEKPQHLVQIPAFFLGKYPITQAQWYSVAQWTKIERELQPYPSAFRGDSLPVEQVSWQDALEFCQRLSRHSGKHYRLPSEAEWEYACRAKTMTPFYFGPTLGGTLANYVSGRVYLEETPQDYPRCTTPVDRFPPNAFGLYDLHGNVWEWCADLWHDSYQGAPTDGSPWLSGGAANLRVLRGGAWDYYPQDCRSASRHSCPETARLINKIGFRVACS